MSEEKPIGPECLPELVKRVKVFPGWRLEARERAGGQMELLVVANVPNRDDPTKMIDIFHVELFPDFLLMPMRGWLDRVYVAVKRAVLHELDEFFVFDGVRLYDPHKDENRKVA